MNRIQFAESVQREHAKYWWGDWLDVRYLLRERVSEIKGKRVLEIGCGIGLVLEALDESNELTGVDLDSASLRIARKRVPRASFKKGDGSKLPSRYFDAIILPGVIEYAPNKKKFLKGVHRLLKQNGVIHLTTPNRKFNRYHAHAHLLTEKELEAALAPYFDCEIKGWNPFPPWPYWPPARALARIPCYYPLLKFLCERGWFKESGKTFIVRGVKKRI